MLITLHYITICIQSQFIGYAIVANYSCTKSFHYDLKCIKIASGWGSTTDPAGGAYSAPPDPLAVREGGEGEEGREGKGGDFAILPPNLNFLATPLLHK